MGYNYFNRYGQFRKSNYISYIPFIQLDNKLTDIKVVWKKEKRLDRISLEYYGVPFYGWLILSANPQFGGLEFDIPDQTILRIPFPLIDTLREFQSKIDKYKLLYGEE